MMETIKKREKLEQFWKPKLVLHFTLPQKYSLEITMRNVMSGQQE